MSTTVRRHWPDEEPDVDETPYELQYEREEKFGAGLCERCGHEGHRGDRCPIIQPHLLKAWGE